MVWRDDLLPGSFRDVSFNIEAHGLETGRRVAVYEYPGRDTPATDDLGRSARRYRIRAFIIGATADASYFAQRDALHAACADKNTPGVLNHPYLGSGLSVRCVEVEISESINEGGMAVFNLEFVEAGAPASPAAVTDTAAQVTSGVAKAQGILAQTLAVAKEIAAAPGQLLAGAESFIGGVAAQVTSVISGVNSIVASVLDPLQQAAEDVASAVSAAEGAALGLTSCLSAGVASITSAITGITADPVAVAITDLFTLSANAVLAVQTAPADVLDAIGGQLVTYQRVQADPTLGLLALTSYGSTLGPPTGLGAVAAAAQQADMQTLVQGAATLAVARIYAATDFTSSNAAAAAQAQIQGLVSAQIMAAAASANNALYQAWIALAGQINQDLITRIVQLPSISSYAEPAGLPACVLAQLLYQDGSRGDQLALLNDVPHPGFMPATGAALAA